MEGTLSSQFMQGKLKATQLRSIEALNSHERYNGLIGHMQKHEPIWLSFCECENPENEVPQGWENRSMQDTSEKVAWHDDPAEFSVKFAHQLEKLTILKVVRPDRFQVAAQRFINTILGE